MILVWSGLALWGYAYGGYPLLLALAKSRKAAGQPADLPDEMLPSVSVSLPVHNEAASIRETLDRILASDYPREKLQVVVVSDASADGTDEIVRSYADRGVELVRLPVRTGKTGAENAGRQWLRGAIVINTDASVRVHPGAIRHLVRALADPTVGVASSRDVSTGHESAMKTEGEGTYVGYEMWVRDLETRAGGIVGASGSLYAIRAALHRVDIPDELSRDFGAALTARRHGFRAVSVPEAICYVPRGVKLRQEYRRKVRTMARGLRTLRYFKDLLDPVRHGAFAWKLWSHKLVRWLLPWATLAIVIGGVLEASSRGWGWAALLVLALSGAAFVAAARWPEGRKAPRLLSLGAFLVTAIAAGLHAWWMAGTAPSLAKWEPTRRGPIVEQPR
jgi:cellulose synthase/poly-beta-1,6-N-acetylglucosamine synthase-like glycosyltransferase